MPKLKFKQALGCFIIVVIIGAAANVWLWLSDHQETAIALLVGLAALISFTVASGWSALLLRTGAEIATRSQESDNRLDIAQAKVVVEMIKAMRGQIGAEQQPQIPMLEQPPSWRPPYPDLVEGEFEEVERRRDD